MKKLVLEKLARGAQVAIKEASNSKCPAYFYEPPMPQVLKAKKENKNLIK